MRFLIAGLAMLVATSVAAHDETSDHSHASIEPPVNASIVEKRVYRFKQSGAAIQSVFKQHLGNDDFASIAEAATLIADWADVMPDYFPAGSTSPGARDDIWADFDDFKSKAADNSRAARDLYQLALVGTDKGAIETAAKKMGGTCKACHQSYQIKK